MREDPVVNEIRGYRDQRAAKFNYNLRAIAEDAKKRERQGGRQVVLLTRPEERSEHLSGKP